MVHRQFRIGVVQMECEPGNVPANLDRVAQYVQEAHAEGIDLLVFPELALSGYALGDAFPTAAIRTDSPHARRLKALSRDVALSIGFIEETHDVEFFNSVMFLVGGEVCHVHRKVYPPNYRLFEERRWFGAGWGISAFDTPWGRMACLICGDCWHVGLPYLAAHDGANILLVHAASSREGLLPTVACPEAWERMNRSYALTLSCFVVFSNRVGQEGPLHFWGGSHICLPDGNLLAQAPMDEPHMLMTDVDLRRLRDQRLVLPFRRDDSLTLTMDNAKRVLRSKAQRRDGFFSEVRQGAATEAPPAVAAESRSTGGPPPEPTAWVSVRADGQPG